MIEPPPPHEPEPPRRRVSVAVWAMMALCLLCVLAGAAVVAFGPMFTGHG
jgi:nitrate reductase NapE component